MDCFAASHPLAAFLRLARTSLHHHFMRVIANKGRGGRAFAPFLREGALIERQGGGRPEGQRGEKNAHSAKEKFRSERRSIVSLIFHFFNKILVSRNLFHVRVRNSSKFVILKMNTGFLLREKKILLSLLYEGVLFGR